MFVLAGEGLGAVSDISILIGPMLLIAILDLPVFILALVKYSKIHIVFNTGFKFKRIAIIVSCLLIIISVESVNFFNKSSIITFTREYNVMNEIKIVQRYGTLANSIINFALNSPDSMIKKLKYGKLIESSGKPNAAKPNFVIIQVESMDSNIMETMHNGEYIMPYLHSLSQSNVYYPYTLSYHLAGGTSDSEFSIINDVPPLSDFPAIKILDYSYPNSIIKKLSKASYSTIAFHGNDGSYFSRNYAFPKMGFQEFADIYRMGLNPVVWGAPDGDVFSYIQTRLKTERKPFLAYAITMSSHGPFISAEAYYKTAKYNDEKNEIGRKYFTSMSYVDQALRKYVEYIRNTYKNTYILIWGDHTPAINFDGYKQASFVEGNNYFEFVPIIILTPDKKMYTENKISASFLDIALTIANASNIPYKLSSDGIDLLERADTKGKNPIQKMKSLIKILY
jgi:phosphoglycerol transferase MdoB-like AlkP superfamily enzyme